MTEHFPIGGPRQAVYDALKSHGFTMSRWSDKQWDRVDGVTAIVYGTGSRLELSGTIDDDGPLGEVLERLESVLT